MVLIELDAAIDAMMRLQAEDIEAYGASIPEGFDGDRAVMALKALPPARPVEDARAMCGECDAWNQYKNYPQPGWVPCSEKMPPDYQWYYATCKSLVDNRENWVVEGCYTPWEHFDSTPMIKCGQAEVIAWMPKEFPEPWEGGRDNGTD